MARPANLRTRFKKEAEGSGLYLKYRNPAESIHAILIPVALPFPQQSIRGWRDACKTAHIRGLS